MTSTADRGVTLVTGATGFLGNALVETLVRRDGPRTLRVFSQNPSARHKSLGVETVAGSVTAPNDVERAVTGVARIYHLAGMVSRKPEDASKMYAVHVEGTRLLCRAATAAGVRRMVLASTSGTVAVARRADELPDEDSPAPVDIIGRWPYYASKLYQEETARREAGSMELITVNPSLLLGPGDDRLSSTRDVLALLGGDVPVVPSGGMNFVDVRDVAAALPVAMERGRPGERYLMGGSNWTCAEFFGRLARLAKVRAPFITGHGRWPELAARAQAALLRAVGRTPPVDPESVEMGRYFWYLDDKKARAELGFVTRDPTETLLDTLAYVRERILGRRRP